MNLKEVRKLLDKRKIPKFIKMKKSYYDKVMKVFAPPLRKYIQAWTFIPFIIDDKIKEDFKIIY